MAGSRPATGPLGSAFVDLASAAQTEAGLTDGFERVAFENVAWEASESRRQWYVAGIAGGTCG